MAGIETEFLRVNAVGFPIRPNHAAEATFDRAGAVPDDVVQIDGDTVVLGNGVISGAAFEIAAPVLRLPAQQLDVMDNPRVTVYRERGVLIVEIFAERRG